MKILLKCAGKINSRVKARVIGFLLEYVYYVNIRCKSNVIVKNLIEKGNF